jgi:hypothetical protein
MSGVLRTVAEHHLNVKPSAKQAKQCLIAYIGSTTISNLAISINEGNLAIFIGSWEFEPHMEMRGGGGGVGLKNVSLLPFIAPPLVDFFFDSSQPLCQASPPHSSFSPLVSF